MAAITPAPIRVQILRAPEKLREADEMEFVMQAGPIKIPWLACIENVSPTGFTDRQLRGPFRKWVHRHSYVRKGDSASLVFDEITLELKLHPWWSLVGLGMMLGLPFLFAYRARQTRKLLERQSEAPR
jgi:ligand-binding SRPBCC domain-containing protein